MSWPAQATLPEDERAFRDKFWREVVRREDHADDGMPNRREQALMSLCVRRAKALQPYADCADLDRQALERLRADNLVTYSDKTDSLAAPAHDALEDWAVLRWIEQTHALKNDFLAAFAEELGSSPSVRRAYRMWLTELLDASPLQADSYVTAAIHDASLPAYFRDDTLVSALLSPKAPDFLDRIKTFLVQDDCLFLRRVVHLVRVACKMVPPWIRPVGQGRAIRSLPSGSAWPAVLRLVRDELDRLSVASIGMVVGLLTDWAAGLSVESPHPQGIEDAAGIAYQLLSRLDHYSQEDSLEAVLQVVVKIPTGDIEAFAALARRASLADNEDKVASDFAKLLLTGIYGMFACMDAPDVVIALAETYYKESGEGDLQFGYSHLPEIESVFGLNSDLQFEFSVSSALRGPFLPLLRYHPVKGARFILDLLNYACEKFAQRHRTMQHVEGPREVSLSFPDGTTRKQWCEERLWALYRGTTVAPGVLQCALMALEAWLLQIGEQNSECLEEWLIYLARESNNVAVTAVVASVATAFPNAAGKAGLVALSCRNLILLDKHRLVSGSHPSSWLSEFVPMPGADSQLYAAERRQSDQRAHRKFDLESLSVALATGPLQDRVYALIDAHRAMLPPEAQQNDSDKIWRLALHRMDLRRHQIVENILPSQTPTDASTPVAQGTPPKVRQIMLEPRGLEADLENFVRRDEPQRQHFLDATSLLMWAVSCWRGEANEQYKPTDWRQKLVGARKVEVCVRAQVESDSLDRDAPGLVAAVCARDHWDEMDQAERQWSVNELVSAIRQDSECYAHEVRVSINSGHASRPSAQILPFVLTFQLDEEVHEQVREAIVLALTHPCEEVVAYAAAGIGAYLSKKQPAFVLSCVRALAVQACRIQQLMSAQAEIPFVSRLPCEQLECQVRPQVVKIALSDSPCSRDDLLTMDLDEWPGRRAMSTILVILQRCHDNPLARDAFELVVSAIDRWWRENSDRTARYSYGDRLVANKYLGQLAEFCLRLTPSDALALCDPIVDAVDSCSDDVASFIKQLIFAADRHEEVASFWTLWQAFARRIAVASWLDNLDTLYRNSDSLLSAMFLGDDWKEGVRHWRCLDGFSHLLDQFFQTLPPKPTIFRYYAIFLNDIGQQSLPQAFVVLSRRLHAGNTQHILSNQVVVFSLESLLRRHVYSRPAELKARQDLRDAVLYLLDELVTAGSSAAYHMRDDFVTPGSSNVCS